MRIVSRNETLSDSLEMVQFRYHKPRLDDQDRTSSRTRNCDPDQQKNRRAYSSIRSARSHTKRSRRTVNSSCPVLEAGEAKEQSTYGLQSQDATEDEDSREDRRKIPSRQGGKGRGSWGKEVVRLLFAVRSFW